MMEQVFAMLLVFISKTWFLILLIIKIPPFWLLDHQIKSSSLSTVFIHTFTISHILGLLTAGSSAAMEAVSEGDGNKNMNQSPAEEAKRPKRQMKTPFQLEELEKTYSTEAYPCEATRAVLSQKLGLTDRQLQMWFCHRRLKDKKDGGSGAAVKPHTPVSDVGRGPTGSVKEEFTTTRSRNGQSSGSGSASGSGSRPSQFVNDATVPIVLGRYYESRRTTLEQKVIACFEAQLGEPLREDGPILGVDFEELLPGAFGAPIVPTKTPDRCMTPYDGKLHGQYDTKHKKGSSSIGPAEAVESKNRTEKYGHIPPAYAYGSLVDGANTRSLTPVDGNGHLPWEAMDVNPHPGALMQLAPSSSTHLPTENGDAPRTERKRKSNEARLGREAQAQEKKIQKELQKQDLLRRKREEQTRKEMEKQERERRKEEKRRIREQQKLDEKSQREERREMERREKYMQRENQRAEKKKQKEEHRREREAARQKAAVERATARRIAKESMELIEDERLELMELAAASNQLPSIAYLTYDMLQNLESFRGALCEFPPHSVQLKVPFAIQPWSDSEEAVGNLLMVWKFFVTFADILGLWPFTLDEFIQALHDSDSRLLGEIHIAILTLMIKDIEDVVKTPSGGPGTNQYSSFNPDGGYPHIVEGAYLWGFDIRNWQKYLNPLTWPEVLRQFALCAGFGPQLKKKGNNRVSPSKKEEGSCKDIVSALRNGSAVEKAVAIMQEKRLSLQRRSRHRLTPGTVKFAAYHVLALEGSKGLNAAELTEKIRKSGLRDLTTSKTPEASISVALSRDPILFERVAPSTYCVRPAFRKDPDDAESVIAAAKEKIQQYANGFLAGQNADEEERDDDSDSDVADGTEIDALASEIDTFATPLNTDKNGDPSGFGSCLGNGQEKLPDVDLQNGICSTNNGIGTPERGVEIDESRSGEPWVQGLTEGEYSDLSVEERLNALVALIGIANEGKSLRLVLEDRMEAANALKKQMWAGAQVEKRRTREEFITKYDSTSSVVAEGGPNPQEIKNCGPFSTIVEREKSSVAGDVKNAVDNLDSSVGQFISPAQQNGHANERSRLQLKSYIGQRAEELYVYRSLPLGQDRRRNRFWHFVASTSCLDSVMGRIFVESPNGQWRVIDSEEAFGALLASLDTRGIRESHLHVMLQKVEVFFKDRVQRNNLLSNVGDQNRDLQETDRVNCDHASQAVESPSSAVQSLNSDTCEPSHSFNIDTGRNLSERNLLKRYEDFQSWMWKQCFKSSIVSAMAFGKKRCLPMLELCDFCLDIYYAEMGICPSCNKIEGKVGAKRSFYMQSCSEDNLMDGTGIITPSSSPLRVRFIKALIAVIEANVPPEALCSSWTDDHRKIWSIELQNSVSIDGLLQILTQLEGAIEREHLSAYFETAEELLCNSESSRDAHNDVYPNGTVPQLPWIPKTSAAVALRLFELDASIFYTSKMKEESQDEKKMETLSMSTFSKEVQKAETMRFGRYGDLKEENWNRLRATPGSSGYRLVPRSRGSRPRGKSQKLLKGPTSQSRRRSLKQRDSSSPVPLKQEEITPGQKVGRGPRTIRKRRFENFISEIPQDDKLHESSVFGNAAEEPRNTGREEDVDNFSPQNFAAENDDSSDSMGSDDNNGDENRYGYENWGAEMYDATSNRSSEMMEVSQGDEDDENGYDDDEGAHLEVDMESNDYISDRDEEGKEMGDDDISDSTMASGDYSD